MAIVLVDDGTFDTVIRCDACGRVYRFTYDPNLPSANPDYTVADATADYDAFITGCIEEVTIEHACHVDDDEVAE